MVYRALERLFAFILLILSLPVLGILYIIVRLDSPGPFLFLQLRAGKNKQPFWIYKIRTMVWNAEALKKRYMKKNEADGPVFKIKNDPRYTRVGKVFSRIAIDELPQLMNIIEGSMAFVGPRPLPVSEAKKIPARYQSRFSVLPGMTSEWVVQGSHSLSFKKWMELDCQYAKSKSIMKDASILLRTAYLVGKMVFNI
ncbi:MAG: sugar transferase [Candidatus Roizmanbacteria bacterium]|nr:sugar transferase [Candidatus Roizmanbacteria bacterium]